MEKIWRASGRGKEAGILVENARKQMELEIEVETGGRGRELGN
jgi:hypothetical protein